MFWFAHAPANIALIKYMGKKNDSNLPENPSLSYTLDSLLTTVQLEAVTGKQDYWESLNIPGGEGFTLSEAAQRRFLKHLNYLKSLFNFNGGFIVRSSNNFPLGTGLASSASSFAALTKCALEALSELTETPMPTIAEQAKLSRMGSGSSCRSFFAPWALWEGEEVRGIDFPYKKLDHQIVLISHTEKAVSSSEAHQRAKTSPAYAGRPLRAASNLLLLESALELQDWESAFTICWKEFQDMHHLFSSAEKPFFYITAASQEVLNWTQDFWDKEGDGPLVTMDAGPNIHLLYRENQTEIAKKFRRDYLLSNYDVL